MDSSPLSSPIESPPSSRVTRPSVEGTSKAAATTMLAHAVSSDLSDLSDTETASPMSLANREGKGMSLGLPRVGHSPVGSSITRPLSKAGVKVYGKNRTTLSSPKSPIASTSRMPPPNSSPLPIALPSSPSKRKRQPGPASPATPTKRSKGASVTNNVGQSAKSHIEVFDLTSPPTRGRAVRVNSERDISPSPSVKRSKVTSKKAGSNHTLNGSLVPFGGQASSLSRVTSVTEETWSIDSLKDFVWVKVNDKNILYSDEEDKYFWWPAKLLKRITPLTVELFCPPSPTLSSSVTIQKPSQSNILPQLGSMGQIRFTSTTFQFTPQNSLVPSSQKCPANILKRWQKALEQMTEEEAQVNDGFPTSISALYSQSQASPASSKSPKKGSPRKGKRSASKSPSPSPPPVISVRDDWSPPPADDSLSIPGEMVIAKDKKSRRDYWPAQILEYVPPAKAGIKPKYKLRFLDKKELFVTREMFYTQDEDEFATCRLGAYETNRPTNLNDTEQDETELQEFKAQLSTSPFPEPAVPAPDHDEFYSLPMDEQFVYAVPVLERIIEDRYPPAADHNTMFLRGGNSRSQLSQSAGAHGSLYKLEVDKLLACIIHWLRQRINDELRQAPAPIPPLDQQPDSMVLTASNGIQVSGDNQVLSDAAQQNGVDHEQRQETNHEGAEALPLNAEVGDTVAPLGTEAITDNSGVVHSEDIEAIDIDGDTMIGKGEEDGNTIILSEPRSRKLELKSFQTRDMVDYASNVLLPQATYQLLLWRNGERSSLEILPDEDENKLHAKGYELAHQVDFVKSIERLREMKRRKLFGKATIESSTLQRPLQANALGGTRSRPKAT